MMFEMIDSEVVKRNYKTDDIFFYGFPSSIENNFSNEDDHD